MEPQVGRTSEGRLPSGRDGEEVLDSKSVTHDDAEGANAAAVACLRKLLDCDGMHPHALFLWLVGVLRGAGRPTATSPDEVCCVSYRCDVWAKLSCLMCCAHGRYRHRRRSHCRNCRTRQPCRTLSSACFASAPSHVFVVNAAVGAAQPPWLASLTWGLQGPQAAARCSLLPSPKPHHLHLTPQAQPWLPSLVAARRRTP